MDGWILKDEFDVFIFLVNSNMLFFLENCFIVIGLKFVLFDDYVRSKMVVMDWGNYGY